MRVQTVAPRYSNERLYQKKDGLTITHVRRINGD